MVRSSLVNPTLKEARRDYEIALKNLRGAYHREVLSAFSLVIDNAFESGDIRRVEQYKSLVDYLVENQDNPQAYNRLEKVIAKASEAEQETERAKEKPEDKPRGKRRFKRRYWNVDESINAMREADLKKWGKERTREAYFQKLRYLDEKRKATTLYKHGRLARLCIADIKSLLPELTRYSPR